MVHAKLFKKVLQISLLVLLIFSQAGTVSAGGGVWVNRGPEGVGIPTLVIDPATPTTIYAGTHYGVFKSTNSGGSWSSTGFNYAWVNIMAIDPITPSTLYVGTSGNGIYKSTNAGGSWSATYNLRLVKPYHLFIPLLDRH